MITPGLEYGERLVYDGEASCWMLSSAWSMRNKPGWRIDHVLPTTLGPETFPPMEMVQQFRGIAWHAYEHRAAHLHG